MHIVSDIVGICPGMGFGLTALTLVSYQSGFNPQQLRATGFRILYLGVGLLSFCSLILMPYVSTMLGYFSLDQSLFQMTLPAVHVMMFCLNLHVGCQILRKCLEGIGAAFQATLINLLTGYCFTVPVVMIMIYSHQSPIYMIWYILGLDRLIKFILMLYQWHRLTRTQPDSALDRLAHSPATQT